jgi:hypothetical protein
MKIPVPHRICRIVSERAAKNAREDVRSMGWSDKSMEALVPLESEENGLVGIRSKQKYLMYQERGIKPFLMTWVQGRVIPMGCKQGDGPHFVTGGHVGEPGYVNIPHVGRVYREQRWRHPGIRPKHFMQSALDKAIKQSQPEIKQELLRMMRGNR